MTRVGILEVLRAAASTPGILAKRVFPKRPVRYEIYGSGPVLFLGPLIGVGPGSDSILRERYLHGLADYYRIVVMDYPPTGTDADRVVDAFTPDHVCADILAVADAVEAERFAWYGYSWGGVVGLQLAARTERLTALVCGGFPPFGASYENILAMSEAEAQRSLGGDAQLMVTFFSALRQWRDRETVATFTCPRMTFAGGDDVVVRRGAPPFPVGPLISEHRAELEDLGWTVQLVSGHRHDLFARPDIVVPLVRDFLDPILLRG